MAFVLPLGADTTWNGSGGNNNVNNSSNWTAGVPLTNNSAKGQILTFGAESGGGDYIVLLNQGDNKDVQDAGTILINGGSTGYTFNRTGSHSYAVFGRDPTGNSIVNTSGNLATFNVPIEQSAQNSSSFTESIWSPGSGGLMFNQTVSFANSAKDVLVSGSGNVDLNGSSSLANSTGSSAVIYAGTGTTITVSGTVGITGDNAGMHGIGVRGGTFLLDGPTGVDLIQDSDNTARGTRLELQGGTFGYTSADNDVRRAEFYRSLTATADSTIQFGNNVGGGTIAFVDTNTTGGNFNNNIIVMSNWNGTFDTGGGTDQFVFSSLYNGTTEVMVGDTLPNVRIFASDGFAYYAQAIASPTYLGAIELVPGMKILPEPTTYAFGGFFILSIVFFEWRRRNKVIMFSEIV
ncbi:hypothetical protein ACFFOV_17625 [Cerasicoccus arenae]